MFSSAGGSGGFDIMSFLPLVMIFVVFYFLLIRPQQKKAKQHKELLAGVRRGDRVVTAGGIIGTVTKVVNDGEVMVEISEGVRVRVIKGTITDVLAKPEPRSGAKADKADAEDDEDEPAAPPAKVVANEAKPKAS